jgi:hypothetical protein
MSLNPAGQFLKDGSFYRESKVQNFKKTLVELLSTRRGQEASIIKALACLSEKSFGHLIDKNPRMSFKIGRI